MLLNHTILAWSLLSSSLPYLVDLYEKRYREEDKLKAFPDDPPNLNLPVKETFDFIIVGAGTAGSVLAGRLSEHKEFRVLLLEAGGNQVPLESSLYLSGYIANLPGINYVYKSNSTLAPEIEAEIGVRQSDSSAGKMLGGSSAHNGGLYERGHPLDFDAWANITGDDSWNYTNVLKYFLKTEDYHGEFYPLRDAHAIGGPLPVTSANVSFRDDLYFSAGKDLGYQRLDSKGPQKVGFSPTEYYRNITTARRVSTYDAYIKQVEGTRENLVVRRYSVASEIIFDKNRAVGVAYERHGVPSIAFASKEVIISAGAFISPLLLIKSGIGPEDQLVQLEAAGAIANRVATLPVGENLIDHNGLKMPKIVPDDLSVILSDRTKLEFQDFNAFVEEGKGPLAAHGKHEAFIPSSRARAETVGQGVEDLWPDLQVNFRNLQNEGALTITPVLVRPRSRGRITFNHSAVTLDEKLTPVIDYNLLSDPSDLDVLIEGIEFCQKIVRTHTFEKIGAKFQKFSTYPACENKAKFGSREYWKCYVEQMVIPYIHQAGTARMGKVTDPKAVVDSKLRVIGVSGLRVCDASIMPSIINAGTFGPVIMLAEKTADDILNDYKKN